MIWYISGIMLFFIGLFLTIGIAWAVLEDGDVKAALLGVPMLGLLFFGLSSLCFFKAGIYADYETFRGILTLVSNGILAICGIIFIVAAIAAGIKNSIKNPIVSKMLSSIIIAFFISAPAGYLAKELLYSNPLVQEKMWTALSILAAMLGLVLG